MPKTSRSTPSPEPPAHRRGRPGPGPAGARALALCGALAACQVHRGEWAAAEPGGAAPAGAAGAGAAAVGERPAVRILLIGDAGHRGRGGAAVARALGARLQAGRRAGVPTILLWLGDNLAPARCDGAVDPRTAPLAEVAAAHVRAGGASFAAVGGAEWACAAAGAAAGGIAAQHPPPGAPFAAPALNYVVRVEADGRARPVSRCEGAPPVCALEAPPDGAAASPPLLELVVLDSAAWLAPPPVGSPERAAAERSLAEQAALLAALEAAPGPERLLVTHHPVESAGPHGQGGRWPDSAYYLHAEPLRAAIRGGAFVGALAGHEHAVQVSADLTPAIKRSSRVWIEAPLYGLASGAAAAPDAWIGARSWRYFQGLSLAPDAISNHAGFAELTVQGGSIELAAWARRAGRWRRAAVTVPRRRPPHPSESRSPGMEFCLQCDTVAPRE